MKIISNDRLIKRNGKIGNVLSLASIVVLGVGMFFSFKDKDGSLLPYTFTALILGFLLFQVGNHYMSKWGKSPRPDERLNNALKGLDDRYSLYHYSTGISHLLVSPSGIFCLLPYNQSGSITYDVQRNRWSQKGGNFFMKAFGGESLGRPESEAKYAVADAEKYLKQKLVDTTAFPPEALFVFTNEKATLEADESPISAVTTVKVKEFLRKKAKERSIPVEEIRKIEEKINA